LRSSASAGSLLPIPENIGIQRAVVTISGLANALVRVLTANSERGFSRKDHVDIALPVPAVNKARDVFSFEAKVDVDDCIMRMAEYYRRHLPFPRRRKDDRSPRVSA
jgi:UDP-glucose 4-epimerase